jgi:hypothetical protein
MKKILLLMLSLYGVCNAQTTVTKAFNDPVSGDNPNYLLATGTPNNSGTGANITFNNSSLVLSGSAPETTLLLLLLKFQHFPDPLSSSPEVPTPYTTNSRLPNLKLQAL